MARSKDKLEALAQHLSESYAIQAFVIASDLSKMGSAKAVAQEVSALGLSVDILINNAGFGTYGHFHEIASEREQEEIMLNVASLVDMTHLFLPHMLEKQEGIVVNVASLAAFQPAPYLAVYSATKAFVLSFTEALWAEYRHDGVRFLALCPGATQTNFFDVAGSYAAAGGTAFSTPEKVVQAGFRGIERGQSYIVEGSKNYFAAQLHRLIPRKTVVRLMERIMRAKQS